MKKWVKWVIRIGVPLLIAGLFFGIPYLMPKEYDISRTLHIPADKAKVFNYFVNPANIEERLRKQDDELTFSVINSKKVSWAGPVIGNAEMIVDSAEKNEFIAYRVEQTLPKDKMQFRRIDFEKSESGTKITMHEKGKLKYPIGQWYHLINKSSIAKELEAELLPVLEYFETIPEEPETHTEYRFIDTRELYLYTVKDSTEKPEEVSDLIAKGFQEIRAFMAENEIAQTAPPITISRKLERKPFKFVFESAIPVDTFPAEPTGRIAKTVIPQGKALLAAHWGPYEKVAGLYAEAARKINEAGMQQSGASWEQYINNPEEVAPREIETHVYIPIIPIPQQDTATAPQQN